MMPVNESIFLVSNDELLSQTVSKILNERFRLSAMLLHKNEFAKILFMENPLFILWDGRMQTDKDDNLLLWLREHLHGKPIVAILDHKTESATQHWYQHGINMFCYSEESSFEETLIFHTQAIQEHCEKRKETHGSSLDRVEV